jgi:hypothetical protein
MGSFCYILVTLKKFMAMTATLSSWFFLDFEFLPWYWELEEFMPVVIRKASPIHGKGRARNLGSAIMGQLQLRLLFEFFLSSVFVVTCF